MYWLESLLVLGQWEEAERVVAELAVELDHPSIAGEWEGTWGLVLARQGRLDEARPLMERAQTRLAAGSVEHPAWLLAYIVEFAAIDHTLDALAPLLDERVAAPLGDPTAEADAVGAVFTAIGWPGAGADGAVARSAACWHERAKAVRATLDVSDPDSPLLLDAADAQWDRLQGRSDPERWATIADGWSRRGRPFDEALARFHVAEAQLGGVAGRTAAARTAASEQLTKASAIAASLRAGPLLARTLDLARRARIDLGVDSAGGVPARSAPDALATLTSREMDVLDLLAAGRTNGEIGKALFISTKTASVHVSHILAKLGVSNRVEAAAVAVGIHAARAATPP